MAAYGLFCHFVAGKLIHRSTGKLKIPKLLYIVDIAFVISIIAVAAAMGSNAILPSLAGALVIALTAALVRIRIVRM